MLLCMFMSTSLAQYDISAVIEKGGEMHAAIQRQILDKELELAVSGGMSAVTSAFSLIIGWAKTRKLSD